VSEFARADGDRYHETPSCAPAGADRVLAEFALAAGMEPCGVCGPCEPRDRDLVISEEQLVDVLVRSRSVQGVANRLDRQTTTVLEAMGQYGLDHLVGGDGPDIADFDGREEVRA